MTRIERKLLLFIWLVLIIGVDNVASAFSPPRGACGQGSQKRRKIHASRHRHHDMTAFVMAAGHGETAKVNTFLKSGIDVNAKAAREGSDVAGQTALMAAAGRGHVEIVRILLRNGAEVNTKHEVGGTALTGAAARGHLEVVKALLAAGADSNVWVASFHGGIKTALQYAMQPENKNWREIVEAMITAGAEVNPRAGFILSPLRGAIEKEDAALLKTMIELGADVNLIDDTGSTPLMFAVQSSSPNIVKALLDAGAHLNAKNKGGETALAIAMKRRKELVWGKEVIEVLRQAGGIE